MHACPKGIVRAVVVDDEHDHAADLAAVQSFGELPEQIAATSLRLIRVATH
jgi:hypothetical protein